MDFILTQSLIKKMKMSKFDIRLNLLFIGTFFSFISIDLIIKSFGVYGTYLPNFVLSIILSFAFHKPIQLWLAALAIIIGESSVSTTPGLMSFLIIAAYIFVSRALPKGGLKYRNFHMIVFMLITIVIYSFKILYLYFEMQRVEVAIIIIKMLVTIIIFPLFYIFIEKFLKLFKC
jgi:hypothetical protein